MTRFVLVLVSIAALSAGVATLWNFADKPDEWSPPAQKPPAESPSVDQVASQRAQAQLLERTAAVRGDSALKSEKRTPSADDVIQADERWDDLPRTQITIRFPERFLEGSLSDFPIDRIFRSPDLNSFDAYVSKSHRAAVRAFVEDELSKLSDLQYSVQDVGYHWLIGQISSRSIQPLNFKNTPAVERYLKEEAGPGVLHLQTWLFEGADSLDWLYSVGGTTYGISFSNLPETRESFSLLTFGRQSLAIKVGEWFSEQGYLTPDDWRSYLERVYKPR